VGVVKRRVLRGLWRRLVGVGIIGPGLLGAPAFILATGPGLASRFPAPFAAGTIGVAELLWRVAAVPVVPPVAGHL
jgi:hypothetical protein